MTLRLFLHIVSLEMRKQMSYRADFWIRALLGFLAELGVYVFLAHALFAGSGQATIRGYDQPHLLVYFVAVMLLGKLVRGSDFLDTAATDIYEGGLTRYLLFPRPYAPFKYAQALGTRAPMALQSLVFGLGVLLFLPAGGGFEPTLLTCLASMVSVLVASLLYFLMVLQLDMVAFWQDNVWSLRVMFTNVSRLLGGAMLPLAMFPEWGQDLLWFLPFRHFYAVPARVFLGEVGPGEWALDLGMALTWCALSLLVARAIWRRGCLEYSGVGI